MLFTLPIVLDLKEKQNQFDIVTLNSFLDIFLTNTLYFWSQVDIEVVDLWIFLFFLSLNFFFLLNKSIRTSGIFMEVTQSPLEWVKQNSKWTYAPKNQLNDNTSRFS